MARPITYKDVQRHVECECGYNMVDMHKEQISHKVLRALKARPRLSKTSNTTWYLILEKYQTCFNCNPDF